MLSEGESKVRRRRTASAQRLERFAHDVAMQGDVDRDLQLGDKAIEQGVDLRVEQRLDGPCPQSITLLEDDGRKRRR